VVVGYVGDLGRGVTVLVLVLVLALEVLGVLVQLEVGVWGCAPTCRICDVTNVQKRVAISDVADICTR
jgi:hypothetical protein